jgi:hypothetical protein
VSDYPEHDKLRAVVDQSQAIGEFLEEFLPSKGIQLCSRMPVDDDSDELSLHFYPIHESTRRLLAEFFGIDDDALEREKRTMLAVLRGDDD